ncbi:MAG: carotenoid 1,2-hydratase [Chloroflexi bacterium]|nr:carotenoid 1,2-hydratase [Chloroflexota bacterium]
MKRVISIIFLFLVIVVIGFAFFSSQQLSTISASVTGLQSNDSMAGYARVTQSRDFKFPDDHGPHPEYQTEWWYYTGNLDSADGRHFAYQLTFFRRAITPTVTPRASEWATNQIYFAHFALTDVKNNTHSSAERLSRGAAGLAGATGNPFRVWLETWNATSLNADGSHVQLQAEDDGRALNLTLKSAKPVVLHGDRGLSQKSAEAGNASYYYSFTRLETTGTITVNGETFSVTGHSWMDHEWSTAVLGPNAVGWDWFSIQLSDNRELMLFQIRQKDGSVEPLSSGTLVEPDGSTRHLTHDQFKIDVASTWKSNPTGATYPSTWNVAVPSANIQLVLKPYVADQEMHVSIVYWEGTVSISGQSGNNPVRGNGFVELTGYAAGAKQP